MVKDALAVRALSAVVLALPVLAAVYYGWPYLKPSSFSCRNEVCRKTTSVPMISIKDVQN